MLQATFKPYRLRFKTPARTSRGVMDWKDTYFLTVTDTDTGLSGQGEVALFKGLSADDTPDFEDILERCCREVDTLDIETIPSSAIRFGFETALADLAAGGVGQPFGDPDMTINIPINGLVWMADKETMLRHAQAKIAQGYRCVKLKIGGIDFEQEIEILSLLRQHFSPEVLELRLDANGAFTPENAMARLDRLARFDIHSIEQPVMPRQHKAMADICRYSPIDVALDEELIGITSPENKREMLDTLRPRYIILKPSLCGGFAEADAWIAEAEKQGIGWWATSALESNVGLNAIARWLAVKGPLAMPQGLGTGMLYLNNTPSLLRLDGPKLSGVSKS